MYHLYYHFTVFNIDSWFWLNKISVSNHLDNSLCGWITHGLDVDVSNTSVSGILCHWFHWPFFFLCGSPVPPVLSIRLDLGIALSTRGRLEGEGYWPSWSTVFSRLPFHGKIILLDSFGLYHRSSRHFSRLIPQLPTNSGLLSLLGDTCASSRSRLYRESARCTAAHWCYQGCVPWQFFDM